MGKLVGKIIGGVVGGAFAIGGAVTISQLDTQTDEINKQVDSMNVLSEKVSKEYNCYAVTQECEVINGTEAEYEDLATKNDQLIDDYNAIVNKYNLQCVGDNIKQSDEQKCIDLNNNAAKTVFSIAVIFMFHFVFPLM